MNREEQLQWEARWAVPTAVAAFVAGLMLLVSGLLFIPEDRKGIEPNPDILLSIHEQSGAYLTSAVLAAVASLILIGVLLYLFRACHGARGRGAAMVHLPRRGCADHLRDRDRLGRARRDRHR